MLNYEELILLDTLAYYSVFPDIKVLSNDTTVAGVIDYEVML
ncbi:MAG: hypothetical protein ACI4UK_01785 [Floccifex sp.]